ncbi:flagellar biosynthesis protein FlhB [Shewanella algae]|uniref:flagellar biosynthesis protein FlhB n=1 Tax=Shewanella algae TaxID=38313 RepID=UPI0011830E83|nr:flagellar biosynthesis protein FlhB [Shewanella algae]TVL13693.1 flagellar biosynthetic protein FlhB [Shewanella algae]
MSQSSSQDKTEKASSHKLSKAREKGQTPRSKDLGACVLMIAGSLLLSNSGDWLAQQLMQQTELHMLVSRENLDTPGMMQSHLAAALLGILELLGPLFLMILLLAAIVGGLPGGHVFNLGNAGFKWSRIAPLSGLKRMCGTRSLVELGKSCLKVSLLIGIMLLFLKHDFDHLLYLSQQDLLQGASTGLQLLSDYILYLGLGMLVIALVDVPYQLWQHYKELRMSKQEVKDEHKQMEGKPEIKARIRQLQQQFARSRASVAVPQADVLMVNPSHYAVALKYDPARAEAPFVLCKGRDEVALYMQQIAKQHGVEILRIPPLTRAIFHSTAVEQQIPAALFKAVAHVLNYVLQIQAARAGRKPMPAPLPEFHIPPHLRHD